MKIVAALCWWNEEPEMLTRCVSSLPGVADRVVAFDGRWEGMPGNRVNSPVEQGLALHDAAIAARIPLTIRTPEGGLMWGSQIEKRDALMAAAAEQGDWILVIDADEHVTTSDAGRLRAQLEISERDVAEIGHVTVGARARNATTKPKRRLFRSAAEPTIEVAHNGIRTADGRWLSGDSRHVELDPAADLLATLTLIHEVDSRLRERALARTEYLRYRASERIEDWAVTV